jgi:hypothetical protein
MDEPVSLPITHSHEETEDQRVARELVELLNEVRVAMPGVQVLFGFLLAVPFQQRFDHTTDFERIVYFTTLLCAAAATAFFVMPVAYHRMTFRRHDKLRIVVAGNASLITGLLFLAVAMVGAVVLATDMIFKAPMVFAAGIGGVALFGLLWFGYPLLRRSRRAGPL